MRRLTAVLFLILSATLSRAQDYSGLDTLLTRFYSAMLTETVEAKNAEFDHLIEMCADSLTRQHVALSVYDHYKESPLMGEEEVAIHIYDRWFKNGRVSMRSEFDRMDADLFADFNRNCLIGMEAPSITLRDMKGRSVAVPQKGCTSIFFFHDTGCANCELTAKLLPKVLGDVDFPVNLYAVNCGSDKRAWRRFSRKFKIRNRNVHIFNLWDPEIDSDYLRLYGVISTPKLYLIEPEGIIIGRRLEPESLREMLPIAGTIAKAYEKVTL